MIVNLLSKLLLLLVPLSSKINVEFLPLALHIVR